MPDKSPDYTGLLNSAILKLFGDAFKLVLTKPALSVFFLRTMNYQRKARGRREKMEKDGVHVPPFLIVSVTDRCNLNCKGCYNQTLRVQKENEMSTEKLTSVLKEARELGFSIALLAGGEPLTRKDLFDNTAKFPDIIFPLFTNGLLIDDNALDKLNRQKNFFPS